MDKVFSARVDETVLKRLGLMAQRLGKSKKKVLERAIMELSERIEAELEVDPLATTCGAWQREESAEQTLRVARRAFRESFERHSR